MSLTERLKAAEAVRLANEHPLEAPPEQPVVDLRTASEPLIDLTGVPAQSASASAPRSASPMTLVPPIKAGSVGISYNPVRTGDASLTFGEMVPVEEDRQSDQVCPRCGSVTQVDLFDQVHQMLSLSCTQCFHMFRVHV
jgi:hypothetical protein